MADEGPSRKRARLSEGIKPPEAAVPIGAEVAPDGPTGGPATGPPPAFSLLRVRGLPQEHSRWPTRAIQCGAIAETITYLSAHTAPLVAWLPSCTTYNMHLVWQL